MKFEYIKGWMHNATESKIFCTFSRNHLFGKSKYFVPHGGLKMTKIPTSIFKKLRKTAILSNFQEFLGAPKIFLAIQLQITLLRPQIFENHLKLKQIIDSVTLWDASMGANC